MKFERLGDHARLIRGITFKPDDKCSPETAGAVVCMRTKNVQSELDSSDLIAVPDELIRNREKILISGDALVSSANSWNLVGKCCFVPDLAYEATAGGFISILRTTSNALNSRYLYRWFSSDEVQNTVRSFANKTTNISNLDHKRTLDLKIPLPDLDEQKRIAAILDQADAIRRKRRQALQLTDDFLRSLFLDMFGDPVTNPKGWKVRKSGELFSEKPRIGTTKPAKGKGYPVVRVGELGQTRIQLEKCGRVELDADEFNRFKLLGGDLVIARAIGSKKQLGKASYFQGHAEPVVVDSHVMRLRPNPSVCNPVWFYSFITSTGGLGLLQKAGGETAVQFNINCKQACSIDVSLPPISEQLRFELVWKHTQLTFTKLRHSLNDSNNLFVSLQQRAFKGEL